MVELGKINTLTVIKILDFGAFLDAGDGEEILLPRRYVPEACQVGDELDVFVYLDSEDMMIATTEKPKAMVGECAYLKVVEVNHIGAFLDWGLTKDLLVPFGEQQKPMLSGYSYVVYLYVDAASGRIAGSSKLDKFLADTSPYYKEKQQVELLICGCTELGYRAVVDGVTMGLLFKSEVFKPVRIGQTMKGYVKRIRPDNKLDLCLQLVNRQALDELSEKILAFIKAEGGRSTLTDKSSPEAIARQFGVSKSSYKKALGKLYKKRLISIEKTHIEIV